MRNKSGSTSLFFFLLALCAWALTAAPVSAAATSSVDAGPLAVWQVKDGITFVPGFRVQTRYSYDQVGDGDHTIQIKRFRLKGSGKLFGIAKYGSELKIDGTGGGGSPTAAVENAWVEFTKLPVANLRVGLYDIPFSRSNLTSDSKLLLVDRSQIRSRLSKVGISDNTTGALFHARPMDGLLEYAAGVFMNEDFGEVPTWSGRMVLNLLDKPGQGGYGDYRGSYIGDGNRLAIGVSAAYMSDASDSSGTPTTFDQYAVGVDIFFNRGPITLQGEYGRFEQTLTTGVLPNQTTEGGYVQAGYVLPATSMLPAYWPTTELAVRYQEVKGGYLTSAGTLSGDDHIKWTSIGLNFYIHAHNLKIQADYTIKKETVEIANNMFQVQLQLDF